MSARKIRRAAEHQARKVARKAGFPIAQPTPSAVEPEEHTASAAALEDIPEPGFPFPSLASISAARLTANRTNAKRSTGPKSPATRSISAQNHTIHGLARHHNGTFKLLSSEDTAAFEALKQSLADEHQPDTETESILVNGMAESHWLASRAQRLQDTCMHPDTGAIRDDKRFSLYMRYQTTHTRAFHKSLNDLLKLRAERRKAGVGFEAEKRKEEEFRVKNEKHEMKRQYYYWDILKKDGEAYAQILANSRQYMEASRENPGFQAHLDAELAKKGLKDNPNYVAVEAA